MRPRFRPLLVLCAWAFVQAPASAAADPVVVELFTSQGCSSCPPADAVLAELAARPDVLPLAFHVTYWDRLGWRDTFGLEASVARQRQRARQLGLQALYTPQMVIGGRVDVVGSDRPRVLRAIEILQSAAAGPELHLEHGRVVIEGGGEGTLWGAAYDRVHEVRIERGENRGRTLRYRNVVRVVREIGRWRGSDAAFELPRELRDRRAGLAVWLERDDGTILASAMAAGP